MEGFQSKIRMWFYRAAQFFHLSLRKGCCPSSGSIITDHETAATAALMCCGWTYHQQVKGDAIYLGFDAFDTVKRGMGDSGGIGDGKEWTLHVYIRTELVWSWQSHFLARRDWWGNLNHEWVLLGVGYVLQLLFAYSEVGLILEELGRAACLVFKDFLSQFLCTVCFS